MPGKAVVVDTSALAALLFGEPAGPEMAERLEGRDLFAPTLLRYEVTNVCLKKARREPEKEAHLLRALSLLPRLGVREVQVPPTAMADVSRRTGLTAYDAAFLWLAERLDLDLISLDARLNAAKRK